MTNTAKKITTELICQNIAPIEYLTKKLDFSSLRIGVFANNGSGKTFLSRLFRLTENNEAAILDENGVSYTDKLLTFGKNNGNFSYKITDKKGVIVEDFQILLKRGVLPIIPSTHYIYHTFNQDYVEENIEKIGYEKSGEIEGFILGKTNIDLKEDEDKLDKIKIEGAALVKSVTDEINSYIQENIDKIKDIKRIGEYKNLNADDIIKSDKGRKFEVTKNIDDLKADYSKVKSVPENLANIAPGVKLNIDFERLDNIKDDLSKEYSLSKLADDFKNKVKNKQGFIVEGVKLIDSTGSDACPFCEQHLEESAIDLIDKYNKYLNDTESKTIAILNHHLSFLNLIKSDLEKIELGTLKQIASFNSYKTKYIPSSEKIELETINIVEVQNAIDSLNSLIDKKLNDISKPVVFDSTVVDNIIKQQDLLNNKIEKNNKHVVDINNKINRISHESLSLRRDICKAAYNHLKDAYNNDIEKIIELRVDWNAINNEIERKREKHKVEKKKKVASTIKQVLNYFFSGKYSLDEETFMLFFHDNALEKGQTKNVLSQGEKNIVAFAYYIGDTYLKVNSKSDIEKIFFIIDDPISSMDFTHVYTLSGVIRDIKKIISELEMVRYIIFTHSSDFMRILSSNKIVDKMLLLNKNEIKEFNEDFTVPYICHLIDVYDVARKGGKPNHTTANSIRHIVETLNKFQNLNTSTFGVNKYINDNLKNSVKSYTLIQDLCHGGFRSEELPISEEDFKNICETVISHVEDKYSGQIEYCENVGLES